MNVPVLPFQDSSFHRITDSLGLNNVKRLERISELEVGLVDRKLFWKVIVGCHGRCKGCSLLASFVRFRRTGWESLARPRVHGWVIDRKDFASVRVDDWYEIARMGVKVVIWT